MKTDLFICVDCYFEYRDHDNFLVRDKETLEWVKKNVKILKKFYKEDIKGEFFDGYLEFSALPCQCCGSRMFGTRYKFTLDKDKDK